MATWGKKDEKRFSGPVVGKRGIVDPNAPVGPVPGKFGQGFGDQGDVSLGGQRRGFGGQAFEPETFSGISGQVSAATGLGGRQGAGLGGSRSSAPNDFTNSYNSLFGGYDSYKSQVASATEPGGAEQTGTTDPGDQGGGEENLPQGSAGGWGKYAFGDERGYQTSPMEDIAFYGGAATHRGPLVRPRDESILRAYSGGTGLLGLPPYVQADWDVNGDGKIDEIDKVPYPYTPLQENSLFRPGAGGFGEPNLGGHRGLAPAGAYGLQEPGPGSRDPVTSGLPIGMDELEEIREMGGIKNWLQQFWSGVAGAAGKVGEFGRQLFSKEDFGGVLGRGVRELEFGQNVARSGAFSGRDRMTNQLLFGKIDEDYLTKYPDIAANMAWHSIKTQGPKIIELFTSPAMDAVWEGMKAFGLTDANIAMFKNLNLAEHAGMIWNGDQAKDQLAKLDERKADTRESALTRWGTSDERHAGIRLDEVVNLKWREYTGNPIRMDWAYNVLFASAPAQLPVGTPRAYYLADMNKKDEFSNRIYLRGTSQAQGVGPDPMNPTSYETPPDATHMRQLVRPSYIDPSTGYPATEMVPIVYGDDPRLDGNNWTDKTWSTQFIHIPPDPQMWSDRFIPNARQANQQSLDWYDQWFRGIYGGGAPEIAGADAQPGGGQVDAGGFQAGGGAGAGAGGFVAGGGQQAGAGTGGFALAGGQQAGAGTGGFAPAGSYSAPIQGGGGMPVSQGGQDVLGAFANTGRRAATAAPRAMTSLARPVGGGQSPGMANLVNRAGQYAFL